MNLNSFMPVKLVTGAGCVRSSAKELAKLGKVTSFTGIKEFRFICVPPLFSATYHSTEFSFSPPVCRKENTGKVLVFSCRGLL